MSMKTDSLRVSICMPTKIPTKKATRAATRASFKLILFILGSEWDDVAVGWEGSFMGSSSF